MVSSTFLYLYDEVSCIKAVHVYIITEHDCNGLAIENASCNVYL